MGTFLKEKKCPVCDNADFRIILHGVDKNKNLTAICTRCGFPLNLIQYEKQVVPAWDLGNGILTIFKGTPKIIDENIGEFISDEKRRKI